MPASFDQYNTPLLQQVVAVMASSTALEKVYVYGRSQQQRYAETIFRTSPLKDTVTTNYDFLVLLAEGNKRKAPEANSLLENAIKRWTNSTIFVLPLKQFNDWLRNAHPFACKVFNQALCCYDAGSVPLVVPSTYSQDVSDSQLRRIMIQHTQRADEFLHGADLFQDRNNHPLAAFHLHQACEQLYTGMIQYVTGLRIVTHNLMTLHRHCRNLVAGVMDIFPMDTEQEKKLFNRLQSAYLGPRYQDDYCITAGEFFILRERAAQLFTSCQSLCPCGTTTF